MAMMVSITPLRPTPVTVTTGKLPRTFSSITPLIPMHKFLLLNNNYLSLGWWQKLSLRLWRQLWPECRRLSRERLVLLKGLQGSGVQWRVSPSLNWNRLRHKLSNSSKIAEQGPELLTTLSPLNKMATKKFGHHKDAESMNRLVVYQYNIASDQEGDPWVHWSAVVGEWKDRTIMLMTWEKISTRSKKAQHLRSKKMKLL